MGFVLLGLALVFEPLVLGGGWTWLLMWAGVTLLVVGAAYIAGRPGIFGKRTNGALGAPHAIALLPFLAVTWAMWHLIRLVSREPAVHRVRPGLAIGRRLLPSEIPDDIEVIVDLTAEFTERGIGGRTYHCLRILDGSIPDAAALALALAAIPPTRTVLVHCAKGHGRTALFTACLLYHRGHAASAHEAITAILVARPLATMSENQRAFVEAFCTERAVLVA
ncbi:MAG: hypothetical protein H0T79_05665 [Deltaproteobacteria bacterium]|nr:hypothetical protein [Deltaproteobacteria bacterium]